MSVEDWEVGEGHGDGDTGECRKTGGGGHGDGDTGECGKTGEGGREGGWGEVKDINCTGVGMEDDKGRAGVCAGIMSDRQWYSKYSLNEYNINRLNSYIARDRILSFRTSRCVYFRLSLLVGECYIDE